METKEAPFGYKKDGTPRKSRYTPRKRVLMHPRGTRRSPAAAKKRAERAAGWQVIFTSEGRNWAPPIPEVEIKLCPKQLAFVNSEARYTAFFGGVGAGKTFTGAVWAAKRSADPKVVGFIGANSYKQLHQTTLPQLFSLLSRLKVGYAYGTKPKWETFNHFEKYDGILSLTTGCQIICRSLENFDSYRGIQVGWAWIDETRDTKHEAFTVLAERLRGYGFNYKYQLKLTTTPCGFNWLYYAFAAADRLKSSQIFYKPTKDNQRHLPKDYVKDLEETLGAEAARQQLGAEFIAIGQGSVFEFSRTKNLRTVTPLENDVVCVGIDFNVHPMTASLSVHRGNNLLVFDEIYIDHASQTSVLCAEILRRLDAFDHVGRVEVDADIAGAARHTNAAQTDHDVVREHLLKPLGSRGADFLNAYKERNVFMGVQMMNGLLSPVTGDPKIYIDPGCTHLIKDLEQMVWVSGTRQIDKKKQKELTHMADNFRYVGVRKRPELVHPGGLKAFMRGM